METNDRLASLTHPLISAGHFSRRAIVYLRQSTDENAGSSRVLYESQVQFVRAYGWPEHLIEVIDEDMGKAAVDLDNRTGWQHILAEIANNSVGIISAKSVSRLTPQPSAYEQLRSLAADHGTLLRIGDRIAAPSDPLWRVSQ